MRDTDLLQFIKYLETCREKNETKVDLALPKAYAEPLMADNGKEILWALCRTGFEPYARYSYEAGHLQITDIFPCGDTCYTVPTEEKIKSALQDAGRKKLQKFRLLMPETLIRQLSKDNQLRLKKLEGEAGVFFSRYSVYEEVGLILYTSFNTFGKNHSKSEFFTFTPPRKQHIIEEKATFSSPNKTSEKSLDIPILSSLGDVYSWIRKQANAFEKTIVFKCPPSVLRSLQSGILDNAGKPLKRLSDLCNMAGIFKYTYSTQESNGRVELNISSYYPGFHIIRALQIAKSDDLSVKEKQTLSAAKALLAGIHESSPPDIALAISRAIGQRTVYTIDDTSDEDDCAIGPLLNGKANCDGYADAFYLCASLAGLKVGYQYGCSNLPEHRMPPLKDSNHLWNRIYINNCWTMLDATWDHNNKGDALNYIHFMIGKDRAKFLYRWNEDLYPALQEITDPHRATSIFDFRCRSRKDVIAAFKEMKRKRISVFYIFPETSGILDTNDDVKYYLAKSGVQYVTTTQFNYLNGWRIILR